MRHLVSPLFKFCAKTPVVSAGAGFMLVLLAIALGTRNFLAFFSLEGLVIVVGGVIAVAFMSFDVAEVRKALSAIVQTFKEPKMTHEDLHRDITAIIYCARLLREKGMRNLESVIQKSGIGDPFVKYGLNMVVSEYSMEEVRAMMETAADAYYERDSVPVDVLHAMASHAPAFGMVGTLVGMVAMLCTMNDNVAGMGSTLAVAFISTLYGVLTARLVYMPAAAKLEQKVANRRFRNYLITEGMVMLVGNKSPMYVQDRLNSFLRLEGQDTYNVVSAKHHSSPLHNSMAAAA